MNTDLLVIATLLHKIDPFFYDSMERRTENMIIFLTPVFKWLVDLYSNPFSLNFTLQLLDLLFFMGNWSFVIAAVTLISNYRSRFISSFSLDDITRIYTSIPVLLKQNMIHSVIELIYERCIMTDM